MRAIIPTLSALVVLGACGARPTPPPEDLTAGALSTEAPDAFAAEAGSGAVEDGWLATFADPTLDALVAEALAANRDLAAASARLDQAAAFARQAGADLKPQVGYAMGAAGAGTGDGGTSKAVGAGLTVSWELDVWGRLSSAQSAAQEEFASTAADFEFARQSLAASVAKAYFLLIQAVQQELIAEAFARLQARNVELVTLREGVGRASAFDVALARSAEATAKDQVRLANSGRERAARSLELLLGRYPKAEMIPEAELPAPPPAPPAGLPSELLERRPDLVAATRRVAAAFNQVESAKAARLPRLAITAGGGVSSGEFRSLSASDVFWNLGANLLGPIYDGGRLKEQVVIETAKQQEALANFGQTALRAFQQVEETLAEETRLIDRLALVTTADTEQGEALRLSDLRFEAGVIDQVDLLAVQAQALNTRLAVLAIQTQRLTNRIDLHLALGGGFDVPPPAETTPPGDQNTPAPVKTP